MKKSEWTYEFKNPVTPFSYPYFWVNDGENEIAHVPVYRRSKEETEKIARLIAAAPSLLEALQGMIGILTAKQRERQFPNLYKKAIEAIQKATQP